MSTESTRPDPRHSGTMHHRYMTLSAYALIILVPIFIYQFGSALGGTHAEVVAYYSRPFPALVAALTALVGLIHYKMGAQLVYEDYSKGATRKLLIRGTNAFSYLLIAIVLLALMRIVF